MTSIEQLQQSIDAMRDALASTQKQLDELKQQQPKKLEMWKPAEDEVFFTIHDTGDVTASSYQGYSDYPMDCYFIGNCFPTRELAEYYAKRRAARQRLEMLALAENGMVPYEYKSCNSNYYIGNHYHIGVCVMDFSIINSGVQYFPTRQAAQRVLDAMTDEDCFLLWGTANRGGE